MSEIYHIRVMDADDLPLVLSWRNHPEIRRYMLTQHEIELEEHKNWFEKASNDSTRRLLIVEDRSIPIGYVQFSNVSKGGVADWGFYASPEAQKGAGQILGSMALNHAFDQLHLHKVCGQALDFNAGSIAFHQRMGFTQEGVLRDQHCVCGVYHSLVCFGLLQHEWQFK
jgi:UDP-4-amino-4,6-dideoxy-N-acetyl-beta-L-altrosamine N-acetyltransferase